MSELITSNGLEKIYLGNFEGDLSADSVVDVTRKFNTNADTLDVVMTDVDLLKDNMSKLVDRGFTVGIVNGGVCVS